MPTPISNTVLAKTTATDRPEKTPVPNGFDRHGKSGTSSDSANQHKVDAQQISNSNTPPPVFQNGTKPNSLHSTPAIPTLSLPRSEQPEDRQLTEKVKTITTSIVDHVENFHREPHPLFQILPIKPVQIQYVKRRLIAEHLLQFIEHERDQLAGKGEYVLSCFSGASQGVSGSNSEFPLIDRMDIPGPERKGGDSTKSLNTLWGILEPYVPSDSKPNSKLHLQGIFDDGSKLAVMMASRNEEWKFEILEELKPLHLSEKAKLFPSFTVRIPPAATRTTMVGATTVGDVTGRRTGLAWRGERLREIGRELLTFRRRPSATRQVTSPGPGGFQQRSGKPAIEPDTLHGT